MNGRDTSLETQPHGYVVNANGFLCQKSPLYPLQGRQSGAGIRKQSKRIAANSDAATFHKVQVRHCHRFRRRANCARKRFPRLGRHLLSLQGMRDADICRVLRQHLEGAFKDDGTTMIIEELGLCRGAVRVDVAVINGSCVYRPRPPRTIGFSTR